MSDRSKLFVYGIDEHSPRAEAIAEFAQFGEVTNLFSPRGRKFSFITMRTEEEAEAAIAGLHDRVVFGQPLTVEYQPFALKPTFNPSKT